MPNIERKQNSPENWSLQSELDQTSEKCKSCKICKKECAFLRKYGTPKEIADGFSFPVQANALISFECSLCKLCTAVCPFDCDPAALFLEMRRYAFRNGWGSFKQHTTLINFEKRGTSKKYSIYALPKSCKTVLFPGCAMAASRSTTVKKLFTHLQSKDKNLGFVLDCCTKPSHDLGREAYFSTMFGKLKDTLYESGVRKVLVACPSCYAIFTSYGDGLETKTVYQELLEIGLPPEATNPSRLRSTIASFHDSCTARFEDHIHQDVRSLAALAEINLEEMPHHGKKALCCGEGGGACFISPKFIDNWQEMREKEMNDGKLILTYCAGCANFIGKKKTNHLLDMIFSEEIQQGKKAKVAKAPFTYLYRLALKRWAKKNIQSGIHVEKNTTG